MEQGMVSFLAAPDGSVARRIEQASGIRPVTLLIAFGIVLITGILIATGLARTSCEKRRFPGRKSSSGGSTAFWSRRPVAY